MVDEQFYEAKIKYGWTYQGRQNGAAFVKSISSSLSLWAKTLPHISRASCSVQAMLVSGMGRCKVQRRDGVMWTQWIQHKLFHRRQQSSSTNSIAKSTLSSLAHTRQRATPGRQYWLSHWPQLIYSQPTPVMGKSSARAIWVHWKSMLGQNWGVSEHISLLLLLILLLPASLRNTNNHLFTIGEAQSPSSAVLS